jgi:hypothetical protein
MSYIRLERRIPSEYTLDNVGVVVVEGLTAGTDMLCCITHDNSTFRLTAGADVPIGHKIALKDLKPATPPSSTARTSAR